MNNRTLDWAACSNVRDLGGLAGRIRRGALVRADALQQLSAEGWRALERHGIRTVIDLRNPDEIGEDAAPRPPGLTTIRIPLDGMEDTEFWSQWLERPEFGTPHYYGPWLERFPDRAARILDRDRPRAARRRRLPLRHRPRPHRADHGAHAAPRSACPGRRRRRTTR